MVSRGSRVPRYVATTMTPRTQLHFAKNIPTGTDQFQHGNVRQSSATKPRKWLEIDKLTLGFSHWVTVGATIAVGTLDGYRAQEADNYDYVDLLDDARELPVILYDTAQSRATYTNGEDIILQTLLHRRSIEPSFNDKTNPVSVIHGANPDRSFRSTRDAMLVNADRVVAFRAQLSEPGSKAVLFKNEVKRLYETLDGLREKMFPQTSGTEKWRLNLGRHRINGWEYMSLVNKLTYKCLLPKSVGLGSIHGGWYKFARDSRALVLFASNLGDTLQAAQPESLCSKCLTLPRSDNALTIRVTAAKKLFDNHQSERYPSRLSEGDWTLQAAEDPFKSCQHACRGPKTVALVRRPGRDGPHFKHHLPLNGAIVIGKVDHRPRGFSNRSPMRKDRVLHNGRHRLCLSAAGERQFARTVERVQEESRTREARRARRNQQRSLQLDVESSVHQATTPPTTTMFAIEHSNSQEQDWAGADRPQTSSSSAGISPPSENLSHSDTSSQSGEVSNATSTFATRITPLAPSPREFQHVFVPDQRIKLIESSRR